MNDILNQLGLDETEAKVYLAMLELGPATVSQITRKAAITRTLGYHVLEKLGWKGLVERVAGKRKKIVYSAEHPRQFLQYVKNQRSMWDRRVKKAEEKLPDLVSLFRVAEKPIIRYQEGIEGIKNIYSETLNSTTEILSISDMDGWDQPAFRDWGRDYNRERSRRKIHERVLLLDTPKGRAWMKDYQGSFKYSHYRWIKPEYLPGILEFWGEINIYENKAVMALHKPNEMGVLIENSALVNILKSLFEIAWKTGVPYEKYKK